MDGSFVDALSEEIRRPRLEDGRVFIPKGWEEAETPVHRAYPLTVSTLQAVVDYLTANRDGLNVTELTVLVKGQEVHVYGPLDPSLQMGRHYYLAAMHEQLAGALEIGAFLDAEQFIIGLQSCVEPTPERDELLKLVGSIRENYVKDTVDAGGYSQEVRTSGGVVFVGDVPLKNPVYLAPRRSFTEIDQPVSPFIVRAQASPSRDEKARPRLALIEADGGQWRTTAIERIAAWLKAKLPEGVSVLG